MRRRTSHFALRTTWAWAVTLIIGQALCITGCNPCERPAPINDDHGRIVIYHGVNVANYSKGAPDHLPWQTREDLARLREWGFNHVRYLVFWEAIEPMEGSYDQEYLANTIERIGWLADLDVDVIVDLHQDLYGPRFGSHGIPEWATDNDDRPFTRLQPWNLNYLQPALWAAFDNFWRSAERKAQYVAMVEYLLSKVDGLPNVVGLDIMNEPWPGFGVEFETKFLTQFYEDIQVMCRKNGFKTPLYFEPMVVSTVALPSLLQFKPDPGGVYYPHYYDPLCHEGFSYTRVGQRLLRATVQQRVREANRFGTPLMFGEFGIATAVDGWRAFLTDFFDLMNEYHLGWTYWCYDKGGFGIVDSNGEPSVKMQCLVYVYAQRIAGRDPEMRYQPGLFELTYDPIDTDAPTVVFIPPRLRDVRVTINGQPVSFDPASLHVTHRNSGASARQTIRVEWHE